MHLITKSCVLFLWMHTLSFVKSLDCTLDQFMESSLFDSSLYDVAELEDSYAGGELVRVPCNIGHIGFFRLACVAGNWEPRGTKCQRKSCGHPGEAQFADFRLRKGTDFVFGSEVVYTCQKGYQMVSRVNYRRCMSRGWDGFVPVCEALQCPLIHPDNTLIMIGNTEEPIFGHVIQFSCRSRDHILMGSKMIHCGESGQWSDSVPKCGEIKCAVPVIQNGFVPGDIQEYKENQVLEFGCNPRYQSTEGRPTKCIKVGERADWSPTPVCEPIRCTLDLPRRQGTTYEPVGRNMFSPGDTVTVTCDTMYGISNLRSPSAEITCKEDGKWMITPVCLEVTCSRPQDVRVSSWDNNRNLKKTLNDVASYRCKPGYRRANDVPRATCTRSGWTPNPLCEAVTCKEKEYINANLVGNSQHDREYEYNAVVKYTCMDGYEGDFTVTCQESGWIPSGKCKEAECKRHEIDGADITDNDKPSYESNDRVKYTCRNGLRLPFIVTCKKGVWTDIKSCAGCGKADVLNGFVAGPYNDIVYYACDHGYKRPTEGWWGESKCERGEWSGLQCIDNTVCGESPVIPNGKLTPQTTSGGEQSLQVICNNGYVTDIKQITCVEGQWDLGSLEPICRPLAAIAGHCNPPPRVENAVVATSYQEEYLHGSVVTYKCRNKYTMKGDSTNTCENGSWKNVITCTPYCDKLKDEKKTMKFTADEETYMDGHVIEYQCVIPDPVAEGKATCNNTVWDKTVECKAKSCDDPDETPNGTYDIVGGEGFVIGTTIRYACNDGYRMVGTDNIRTCLLEGWNSNAPTCKPIACEVPEMHSSLTAAGLPPIGETVQVQHKVQFQCSDGYELDGSQEIECLQTGEWSARFPTCSVRCTVPDLPSNVQISGHAPGEQLMKGQTLTFTCPRHGHFVRGNAIVECLANGQWSHLPPTCGAALGCKTPPPLRNGDIKGTSKQQYSHNEEVEYMCQFLHKIEGKAHQTCNNGQWIGQMICRKPCTVTEEAMSRNNIQLRHRHNAKMYASHEDHIEFACVRSAKRVGTMAMRQECIDGVMELPTCQ